MSLSSSNGHVLEDVTVSLNRLCCEASQLGSDIVKTCTGPTEGTFKQRYTNHHPMFRPQKYEHSTGLSKKKHLAEEERQRRLLCEVQRATARSSKAFGAHYVFVFTLAYQLLSPPWIGRERDGGREEERGRKGGRERGREKQTDIHTDRRTDREGGREGEREGGGGEGSV